MVYQTDSGFPTDAGTLLGRFRIQAGKEQTTILTDDNKPTTEQSGIFEFCGTENDSYLGTLATIVLPNGTTYQLSLIYRQQSLSDILTGQALLYLFLWIVSLIAVIVISRLLIKKALKPTEIMLKSQKDYIASASQRS